MFSAERAFTLCPHSLPSETVFFSVDLPCLPVACHHHLHQHHRCVSRNSRQTLWKKTAEKRQMIALCCKFLPITSLRGTSQKRRIIYNPTTTYERTATWVRQKRGMPFRDEQIGCRSARTAGQDDGAEEETAARRSHVVPFIYIINFFFFSPSRSSSRPVNT